MENPGYTNFARQNLILKFVLINQQPPKFDIAGMLDTLTCTWVIEEVIGCCNQCPHDACRGAWAFRTQELFQSNQVR